MKTPALTLLVLACACGEPAEVPRCDPGEGDLIRALRIEPGTPTTAEGEVLDVPLLVSAQVPCLRGGLRVNLRSSLGTLEGKRPGDAPYPLFLAPSGADFLGDRVSGEAHLRLPVGRSARIDAEIGETAAATTIGPY